MSKLYASLTGPLLGLYLPLPFSSEALNRVALNSSSMKRLWCSVYSEDQTTRCISEYGGTKLPDSFARKLDYDSGVVHDFAREHGLIHEL